MKKFFSEKYYNDFWDMFPFVLFLSGILFVIMFLVSIFMNDGDGSMDIFIESYPTFKFFLGMESEFLRNFLIELLFCLLLIAIGLIPFLGFPLLWGIPIVAMTFAMVCGGYISLYGLGAGLMGLVTRVFPYAIFEIPATLCSNTAGMLIYYSIRDNKTKRGDRLPIREAILNGLKVIFFILPFIVVGAIIKTYIN